MFLGLFILLFLPYTAYSTVLLEQTTENALTNARNTTQEIGTGLNGRVVEMSFRVWSQVFFSGANPITAGISCYKFSNYTGLCNGEIAVLVATSTNTFFEGIDYPAQATTTLSFYFNNYTFEPTEYYRVSMVGGSNNQTVQSSGATSDVFPFGDCLPTGSCTPVIDLWFRVITQTLSTGVIEIIEPESGTTTPTNTVPVEVDYYNSGNADVLTLFLYDRVTNQQVALPVFDIPITAGFGTATIILDINEGSYTLQTVLLNTTTGSQFGSVESIDFHVIADKVSEIFGVDIYDPNDLLLLATSTCGLTNLTGCFQNALVFAFVPAIDSFDKFITLKDSLINKPPFGYFALLANELNNINSSTTPAFALASEDNIQTNIFDPIKIGLTWVLWFAFGIWLYKRVRDIRL